MAPSSAVDAEDVDGILPGTCFSFPFPFPLEEDDKVDTVGERALCAEPGSLRADCTLVVVLAVLFLSLDEGGGVDTGSGSKSHPFEDPEASESSASLSVRSGVGCFCGGTSLSKSSAHNLSEIGIGSSFVKASFSSYACARKRVLVLIISVEDHISISRDSRAICWRFFCCRVVCDFR